MTEYLELEKILGRTMKREEAGEIHYESWKNKYIIKSPGLFEEIRKKLGVRHIKKNMRGRRVLEFKNSDSEPEIIEAGYEGKTGY